MAGHASSGATATRSSDSDADDGVGIVSWDYGESARGGLGRAMAEMARVLRALLAIPVRRVVGFRVLFMLWVLFGLQRWIDAHRLRTVILPTGPGGLFLWRKPKGCRLVIVSYHTYWQQARLVPGQWWKMLMVPWERRTLALADRVLCYSLDTERVLLQTYGVHRTKLKLLPQLLNIAAWSPSLAARSSQLAAKEPGLCVFVGRLDRRKGIDVLIRTWERLQTYQSTSIGTSEQCQCVMVSPSNHHIGRPIVSPFDELRVTRGTPFSEDPILIHRPRLVIVGDGPYRREVRSLVARCASVQWIPSLSRKELVELVRRAEVALCPSYLEGFGLMCAEAMAAWTCVMASDCDGLRSLITHGETGWLVRPGDSEALAQGLAALLRDAALRRRLAEAAQDTIRRRFVRADAARLLVLECAGI